MSKTFDPVQHAEQMKRVRSKGTRIELLVDYGLQHHGVDDYQTNAMIFEFENTSGKKREVDFLFPARRAALFVHGCHWHVHGGCRQAYFENSKPGHKAKLLATKERDQRLIRNLQKKGWKTMVIWECSLPNVKDKKYREARNLLALVHHEKTLEVILKTIEWLDGPKTHAEMPDIE